MQALEDVFYRGGFFENNKKKSEKKHHLTLHRTLLISIQKLTLSTDATKTDST